MSWSDDYVDRAAKLIAEADGEGYASKNEEVCAILGKLVRRTVEEAARRCRQRYFNGTAGAVAQNCAEEIEAMLTDETQRGGGR